MTETEPTVAGTVLDEQVLLSLDELCRSGHVDRQTVVELVEEGVLEPAGRDSGRWQFTGLAVLRLRRALVLQRDLDINLPGVALALDLMEEIDRLRRGEPAGSD